MKKFALLLICLVLIACAGDDDKKDAKAEKKDKPPVEKISTADLICPQVAIMQAAQETFDYGGEEPAPSQLVAKARMKSIEGDCAYHADADDKAHDGIDINFTLHMAAARGPRLGGSQVSFPIFIAVVDPAEKVLTRQTVTASFTFEDLNKTAADDEQLHIFIPLPHAAQLAGPDYRVLLGFKLPPRKPR